MKTPPTNLAFSLLIVLLMFVSSLSFAGPVTSLKKTTSYSKVLHNETYVEYEYIDGKWYTVVYDANNSIIAIYPDEE